MTELDDDRDEFGPDASAEDAGDPAAAFDALRETVENLAADIKISFPDATGYSVRNLKYMAKFALRFPDKEIVQAALAQPPRSTRRPRTPACT